MLIGQLWSSKNIKTRKRTQLYNIIPISTKMCDLATHWSSLQLPDLTMLKTCKSTIICQEKRQTSIASFFLPFYGRLSMNPSKSTIKYYSSVLIVQTTCWTTSVLSVFFFLLQLTIFTIMWKSLQPEGAPCSTAWRTDGEAKQKWSPGKKEKKKIRETHTLRLTLRSGRTQHTESQWERSGESVCLSACIYVWWIVSLCVLVKAVRTL